MRPSTVGLVLACAPALFAAVPTPERPVTEPRSVLSAANPDAGPVPIEDLYFTRSVFAPAWSPDGREVLFTTNLTGRFNLWKVSAGGGWPIQLSRSDNVESGGVWSPDGSRIVFQHDEAGDEVYNLFIIPSSGGAAVNLSHTRELSESSPSWSPDGRLIAFSRKAKTSSIFDIGVLDWPSGTRRNLTRETDKDHLWELVTWSADGAVIYANRGNVNQHDADVYRIEVASGALTNLTPHQGDCLFAATALSPDGRTLLVTSNQKGGHGNVATLDVASRRLDWITDVPWEASGHDFSPDGRFLTYSVNEDGRTEVYLMDRASRRSERLDFPTGLTLPAGNPTAFSPSGDRLLLSHQDGRRPSDLWLYDLRARQARQLTFSSLGSLLPTRIPPSQLVRYRSFDGTLISAFLWMPFNLRRDGSNPGIVLAHGGPTGQTTDRFNATVIALASRGYAVIAPNVRGSTGYGAEFERSNYKDLGGGDLDDYVHGAKFLAATGFVDARKIGITGGSYGGYMAMMAIGKTPEVWAAAVELFGITDWLTEQEHEDPVLQQYDQSKLGDPVRDREVYEKASPIRYFRNARAPLLVLQGANDVRDPKEEAEQAVTVLQKEGKVVDSHYYADEGHGFTKRENQIDALRRTVEWFDRFLRPAASEARPGTQH
jgi:dipeptidyl aminopeptidase/acylaminoacyl peptidase